MGAEFIIDNMDDMCDLMCNNKIPGRGKMNIGDATRIFKHINSNYIDDMKKIEAIKTVLDMETHNSITKAEMLEVIDYLMFVVEHCEL